MKKEKKKPSIKSVLSKGKQAKELVDSKVTDSEASLAVFVTANMMYALLTGPSEAIGNLLQGVVSESDQIRVCKISGVIVSVLILLSIIISFITLDWSLVYFPVGCLLSWRFICFRCYNCHGADLESLIEDIDGLDDDEML